jgi:ATP-dependent DNA helicase PIF1
MDDAIQFDAELEQPQQLTEEKEVPCARLIGVAGSGKSYTLLQRTQDNPDYGLLTATTGIAAMNLGAVTLNATLRYFDTPSMRDCFLSGSMTRTLHEIAKQYRWLIVEEYSMLEHDALDILYRAVREANRYADITSPLGILLVGDLAQLPPVSGKWCFRASHWQQFADNTERLDKVWRQDGGPFLDALNLMRVGDGHAAAELLTQAGVEWHTARDDNFNGTTILPVNAMVNRHNDLVLDRVPGPRIALTSRRWGKQRSEWGENKRTHEWGIPPQMDIKLGAVVMIKANARDEESGGFLYVNGDGGTVEAYKDTLLIRLFRNGNLVEVPRIVRSVEQSDRPDGWSADAPKVEAGTWLPRPHRAGKRYVTGQIEFFPVSLGYASTVHKSQGLTLDNVQCDFRHPFYSSPAMMYVSLSRCRSLAGLRLVGSKEMFASRVSVDPQIVGWL